ncbi:hypothetical protein HDU67_001102, partial [Dinochytrium kinnereticum]
MPLTPTLTTPVGYPGWSVPLTTKQISEFPLGKAITTVLSLNDQPVTATIDTGAMISVLDKTEATRLGFPAGKKAKLAVLDCFGNPTTHVVEVSDLTLIHHGLNTLKRRLIVYPLNNSKDSNTNMLLGTDLLAPLGIGITGLPTAEHSPPTKPNLDQRIPGVEYPEEDPSKDTEHAAFLAKLMQAITPSLERNQAIPPGSTCNLPYSVVTLDLIEGATPRFCRQYPIPESKMHLFDQQIEAWDNAGITKVVDGSSDWNNVLTSAPKRDLQGQLTKERVCLDPRYVNTQTIPFRRQSPTAKEILEE